MTNKDIEDTPQDSQPSTFICIDLPNEATEHYWSWRNDPQSIPRQYRHCMICGRIDASEYISQLENEARKVTGETSDGYHTFNELYDYRRVYNSALFNEWALRGKFDVHKSYKHSDGELCFGGGWFVVVAELPTGQVTNHYESKYWNDFQIPEKDCANSYDGHTPQEALSRIATLNKENKK